MNQYKVHTLLFPDKNAQVKELETKHRWTVKLLIGYKKNNKLRNNVKISKKLGRIIRQSKPHTGTTENIENRYLDYNQAERDLEYSQIGKQTTRDRYTQEVQHILQRIKQEN